MLRFVALERVARDVYDPDNDHQREKNCRHNEFHRARHFEISRAALRKRYALCGWLERLLARHFAMKIHLVLFRMLKFFRTAAAAGRGHVKRCTANGSMKSGMRYNQLPLTPTLSRRASFTLNRTSRRAASFDKVKSEMAILWVNQH